MSEKRPNPVRGRVIVEVTPAHAILYLCDRHGYVTDQEVFRYPIVMSDDGCTQECRELFNCLYEAVDSVVNPELQDSPPEAPESK